MSEDPLNALASALRGLAPSAEPLDRDALLFQAGRASVPPRGHWPWVAATAASALLAVGLGLALLARPTEVRIVDRVVPVEPLAPAPVPAPPDDTAPPERPSAVPSASPWETPTSRYEQARDNVLRWGLDGLPPAPRPRHEPVTTKDLVRPF